MKLIRQYKWYEITFLGITLCAILVTGFYFKAYLSTISAFGTIIGTALNYKHHNSCFIWYILASILYAYISFTNKNYGEVIMNVCYTTPSYLIAFILFLKNRKQNKMSEEFEVKDASKKLLLLLLIIIAIVTVGYGFILKYVLSSNYPFLNALATAFATCSIYMAAQHINEQWLTFMLYSIVLSILWFLTSLSASNGLPLLVVNVACTVVNTYVFLKIKLTCKKGLIPSE